MRMRILNAITIFLLVLLGASRPAQAQADERESLSGLKLVIVHLESKVNAESIPACFSAEGLKTTAELRLREAGLTLTELKTPAQVPSTTPQAGILVLRLWVLGPTSGMYVWSVEYLLLQGAALIRNPELHVLGGTWKYYVLGASAARDLSMTVRQAVLDGADAFANEYLAANPQSSHKQ